jgi:hypothetical protein
MALIVAPAEPATSLCSVAAADAYHLARKNASWAALASDDKEANLIKATDYLGQMYGQRWKGGRVTSTQALDWPRYGVMVNNFVVDYATVPVAVANACAELALRAASAPLTIDVGRLKSRTKVGPIEVEYATGSSAQTKYDAVDGLLSAYLGSGSMNVRVVRA